MSSGQNKHIEEYLNYYVSLNIPPNYAVLLRGKWGSGKSWFLKNFTSKDGKHKYLNVSLYGITSYDEIEDAFFKQLHPFLSSEGMKVAGAILKGLLKSTVKIDLDLAGDARNDTSVSTSIPNAKLIESFKKANKCILIFDDLERCSMPILNILGYINQLVENDNLKVIIVSNEEEIIKNDESSSGNKSYLLIKEKLIGKTFNVSSDVDSAIKHFILQVDNPKVKELLEIFEPLLKEIFATSEYNNLRHLRQTISDFERFYNFLPDDSFKKTDLIRHIIQIFFAISFELKKGELKEDDVEQLFNSLLLRKREKEDIRLVAKVITS